MDANDESMETFVSDEEEDDDNGKAYNTLITKIKELSGKKSNKNVVRGIPSISSNVDLVVHASTSKIRLEDLNLKQRKGKSQLKKPRSDLETEKAQRQVARDTLVTEMSKWDPIVHDIRAAPQLIFSKRPHGIKMYEAVQPKAFTPRTPLEKEIYEALGKSEDIIRPNQEFTVAEERALKAMSVKEAKQRRAELLRHHELLSRMELKAKWQNKIKSKRYRKIVRKEKVVAEKKLLEELQKANPEAFLERIGQIEKDRMEERFTLKHRGGGKFSRMHKAYSKFDDKTREAIQEMLQKSRELTKKQHEASSSEDEGVEMNTSEAGGRNENTNESGDDDAKKTGARTSQLEFLKAVNKKAGGWLDTHKTTFVYTQPASESSTAARADEPVVENMSVDTPAKNMSVDTPAKNIDSVVSNIEVKTLREAHAHKLGDGENEVGIALSDVPDHPHDGSVEDTRNKVIPALNNMTVDLTKHHLGHTKNQEESDSEDSNVEELDINTTKKNVSKNQQSILNEPKKKRRRRNKKKNKEDPGSDTTANKEKPVKEIMLVSDEVVNNNEDNADEIDSDDGMKVTMEELFQDEDVVEQFAKEKAEAEERSRPKLEDTKLPGWGSWAGPDYKNSKQNERQKQKAIARAKRAQLQKEKIKQPNVWLNPNRDEAIRKLQPKTVPFPYTSVQQYEASVRQPVSRGFVRETAFKLLTKPEVVTKLGHIIRPLDKDDYVKEKEVDFEEDIKPAGKSHKNRGQKRKSVR
ncbi:hypothetical protein BsWGS_12259 [Bradybaena similaris]